MSLKVFLIKKHGRTDIRKKVYVRFKDNIWAADLADMKWLSSGNQLVKCLLCDINV